MSIDNKKWQNIAEKYDSKAKWAEAVLYLNFEDHDELLSALIDLDPQDLVTQVPSTILADKTINSTVWSSNLNTSKIDLNKVDDSLNRVNEALDKANAALSDAEKRSAEQLADLKDKLDRNMTIHINVDREINTEEILRAVTRELGRSDL